jgi:hypothetical protein
MSTPRRLASRLLHFVLRYAPCDTEEWVNAMLGELDFIEGDWSALLWALGSTAAIVKHSACKPRKWFERRRVRHEGEIKMKDVGKKAAGMVSGVAMATVLAICAYGLLRLSFHFFPSLELGPIPWLAWLMGFVIPEAIFIVAAMALWRNRRYIAVGILLAAVTLGTHIALHIANHGSG